jgi:hypothetical protein
MSIDDPPDDPLGFVAHLNHRAYQAGQLAMWTIYDHPLDFPDEEYVARCFVADQPTPHCISGGLDKLRKVLGHAGLVCLTRSPGDPPKVVETWL